MATDYLIRAWQGKALVAERWATWSEAVSASRKHEAAGNIVRVDWLTPDGKLLDVTHLRDRKEAPTFRT